MNDIMKKLSDAGVPQGVIETLEAKLGNTFQTEILKNWLKWAAAKVGIDTTSLPDIDFKNLSEAYQELTGKDVDGDGKTGIMEAVENVKEAAAHTDMSKVKRIAETEWSSIWSKIKSFFS